MKNNIRSILSTVALLCVSGCGSSCGDEIPVADSCETPSAAGITNVEIGRGTLDRTFEPFTEGDAVPVVFGPQGGAMVAIRMRALASNTSCLAQRTTVYNVGERRLLESSVPLKLYRQDDGSYMTESHYLIFEDFPGSGAYVRLETQVGASTATHFFWLDNQYNGPSIVSIEPESANIPRGGTQTFTVTFSRSASESTSVSISSSNYNIATPDSFLIVPDTGTEATFTVEAGSIGGSAEIGIALGDVWRSVMVTVDAGPPDAALRRQAVDAGAPEPHADF